MALTGIPAESAKGSGGLMVCYGALLSDLTGTTSGNTTTGMASFHAGAGKFKRYVLAKEAGSNFTYTLTSNIANGTFEVDDVLTMVFRRNQVSKRNEAMVLAQSETVWVINDNCRQSATGDCSIGNLYVIGLPVCINPGGCELRTAQGATGAQLVDANNLTLTIGVKETQLPFGVEVATYQAIVAGSAF